MGLWPVLFRICLAMKIQNLPRAAALAVFILFLFYSCGKPPNSAASNSGCLPDYIPLAMVPGTNCQNHCVHVYEGIIDLVAGQWTLNCETLNLELRNLKVFLDHRFVSTADGEYLPTIRIQLFIDGISIEGRRTSFCRRDAFVRSGDQEAELQFVSYPFKNGVMEEMQAIFEEPVERVDFRILTNQSLVFGDGISESQ